MGPATCTLSQMPLTVDQSEKTLFRQMANFAQRCDMVVRTSPVSDVGLLMVQVPQNQCWSILQLVRVQSITG